MKAYKHSIVFVTLICVLFSAVYSQNFQVRWQNSFGGSNIDKATCFVQKSNGGIVVAGNSRSTDGDILLNKGGSDIFILKMDSLRGIVWKKNIGGTANDEVQAMINTPEGGMMMAGSTNSNDLDVSGNHGGYDMWVVKLNSSGDIIWQKCFGGSSWEFARTIELTIDGGYVVSGESPSIDGDITGSHGNDDFWVFKIDSSGSLVWQKALGGSLNDWSKKIIQTDDQGFLIAGLSESSDGDLSGVAGAFDCWITKLDSAGTLQWQHTYGGTADDYLSSVFTTDDHGFLLAGYTSSNDGDVNSNHGLKDCWIVKVDSVGSIQWQKTYGGTADDALYSATKLSSGNFLLTGATSSNNGDVSELHGNQDAWMFEISPAGVLLWQKTLGGSGDEDLQTVQSTLDGELIFVGQSNSSNGDLTFNHGNSDYWVGKLSAPIRKITGHVFADFNADCLFNIGDVNISSRLIHNVQENTYALSTDSSYVIYLFDSDTALLEISNLDSSLTLSCLGSDTLPVYFSAGSSFDTSSINFPIRPIISCHAPEILSLSNSFPRRCTRIVHSLSYTNNGFDTARNARIIIELDTVILDSVASPYVYIQNGDSLIFSVGDIAPYFLGNISFSTSVKCSVPLGVAACTRAYIYPISNCYSHAGYDSTDIQIGTQCSNDTLIMTVKNRMSHAMANEGSVIIFEDEIIQKIDSFKLLGGESNVFKYVLGTNKTWTAELHQNTSHPTQPVLMRHDDLCALIEPVKSTIIIPHFPPHDEAAEYEENCIIIVGSYDPNLKSVSPEGLFAEHLTDNSQVLKYRIDFQNTGTDTAFEVIIVDTLSALLNINTLVPGNASHTYHTLLEENRIVKFVFDPIALPDSSHSEENSHGYITFKIKPKLSLARGSVITNAANIYFDYNTSVRTNSVFNTIYDTVQLYIGLDKVALNELVQLLVFPNPASQKFYIQMDKCHEERNIEIFDAQGKKVIMKLFDAGGLVEIDASLLDRGLYLVKCTGRTGIIACKKIIIQ